MTFSFITRLRVSLVWALIVLTAAPVAPVDFGGAPLGAAWADDDDDDGGGDDDDDDDDVSTRGQRSSGDRDRAPRTTRERQERRPAGVAAPRALPAFAPELVVSDLTQGDLATLLAEGFTVIERRQITGIAVTLDRLAAPAGLTLEQARDRVRLLPSGQDADFNHFYRTAQAEPAAALPQDAMPPCDHENCAAWALVGWPGGRIGAGQCPVTQAIGLIDTGINPRHDILDGAGLRVIERPDAEPSGAVHGTAVASLLIGGPQTRVPGLLPGAEVVAVDVFSRAAGDERADVAALVEGLGLLAANQVRLFNLSLAGPPNTVLARMLDRLTDPAGLDAVIVAAAGNGGPTAAPAWPGAHPRVIAVTAVDARGRPFRQAQRGDHLALAAPGVNLLAATSIRGARGKSGTSFAVPFVTAIAAVMMSQPGHETGEALRAGLTAGARDLGTPGRDPVFGFGLVSAHDLCE